MSESKHVTLWINGLQTRVPEGTTIMEAADGLGVHIPRLCYHPNLSIPGACRVCLVEIEGQKKPVASCGFPVAEGMKVRTHSAMLRRMRRDIVELILDNHPLDCQACERNRHCELQRLAYELGIRERFFEGKRRRIPKDTTSPALSRDPEKCILCGRCVRVCDEVQSVYNLDQQSRGFNILVAPAHCGDMADSVCIQCGQCALVCPTAALVEQNETEKVFAALEDQTLHVVVHVAPSIRAAIGEGFGLPPGTPATDTMVTALRHMGFERVFDTNFGADLTIVEEAAEFLRRMETGERLPLITSCSPGWINFLEHFYPEFIPNCSTCKSPMSMLSTLLKTYYAEREGLDPERIYVVGVMPCTAKKYEAQRPEHLMPNGTPYTDAVLTTRELIWMMKSLGIHFNDLPSGSFDTPLGLSTGAGDIFGATGGVMEAALRTAADKLTGQSRTGSELDFTQVRAVEGLKEADIRCGEVSLHVGVANGLNNARRLLDKAKAEPGLFQMIEIMACPGGCIGGGGQPFPPEGTHLLDPALVRMRANALYQIDRHKALRKSHENPAIQQLYEEFLGEPNGDKAHALLHTRYEAKLPRGI